MRVIRAEVMGMCFGVRDALEVIEGIGNPRAVTIHGQLVHNEIVLGNLRRSGFAMGGESGAEPRQIPRTEAVLITAHGISDRERRRLESAGKNLIDATCPLVRRVHQAAQRLQAQGYHVLVIGRKGHVEVSGIMEDLENGQVIESESDVRTYPHSRLGIVCQTTATERHVGAIRAAITAQNPDAEIEFVDTVCLPTKEHQRALERILGEVDAVVVVGGRNSNNTRELVDRCHQRKCPVLHIESAADLDPAWFKGFATVGLTAGTSSLDETIDQVHRALIWIGSREWLFFGRKEFQLPAGTPSATGLDASK
jgi:4-hydroxy-3-methylbut-2-en-1-yl diphosphate reductase